MRVIERKVNRSSKFDSEFFNFSQWTSNSVLRVTLEAALRYLPSNLPERRLKADLYGKFEGNNMNQSSIARVSNEHY